jgi:hypothetical protein
MAGREGREGEGCARTRLSCRAHPPALRRGHAANLWQCSADIVLCLDLSGSRYANQFAATAWPAEKGGRVTVARQFCGVLLCSPTCLSLSCCLE